MTKDVPYSGLTRVPADNIAPDGALAVCHNIISEDETLVPLPQPRKILTVGDGQVLLVHSVSVGDNFIIRKDRDDNGYSLSYFTKTDDLDPDAAHETIEIMKGAGYRDIAVIGNTLIVADDAGLHYILFRDGKYKSLGSKIPSPQIEFALRGMNPSAYSSGNAQQTDARRIMIHERIADLIDHFNETVQRWSHVTDDHYKEFSDAVHGYLNKFIAEEIHERGYFFMPFMVRYAVRLFDGTYVEASPGVLMLPWTLPPLLKASIAEGDLPDPDKNYRWVLLTPDFSYSQLLYHVLERGLLDDWKDIITGIDVFVSAPIWTYDQSKNFSRHDAGYPIVYRTRYLQNIATVRDKLTLSNDDGTRFDGQLFAGHFQDAHGSEDSGKHFTDYTISGQGTGSVINLPFKKDFFKILFSGQPYYRIASLDPDNVKKMDALAPLPLDIEDLTNLQTFPPLSETAAAQVDIVADKLFSYNSRLHAAGVVASPKQPRPSRVLMPFSNYVPSEDSQWKHRDVAVTIWTRIGDEKCCRRYQPNSDYEKDRIFWAEKNLPRFISVPDSNAFCIEFDCGNDEKHRYPLRPFETTSGAYWFGGFGQARPCGELTPAPSEDIPLSVSQPARLYLSEVDNPFVFLTAYAIGNGRILDISAACRPVSQGQFGQYPLYAFCTDGVWALATNNEGMYSAVHPLSRDLYDGSANITQTDTGVVFPSERGVILLNGSQLECISTPVDTPFPFEPFSRLPHLLQGAEMFGAEGAKAVSDDFRKFLQGCVIHYDYADQRLIFCRSDIGAAYVFSLRSGRWATMDGRFDYSVNAYPQSLIVGDGKVCDFSRPDQQEISALVVTRPMSLDAPGVFKTPRQFIQRGIFREGNVATLLYGSRNYLTWLPIKTSATHRLEGLSGTPYKAFRIAAPMRLTLDENLSGVAASFLPRLTNKLR